MSGRILAIGESDNTGAGGIQGDAMVAASLGATAASAVTCLTLQDGSGIREIIPLDPDFIRRQVEAGLAGSGVDAVKIGFLPSAAAVDAIAGALEGIGVPIVIDAVVRDRNGRAVADDAAVANLKRRLLDRVRVLVATIPNAAVLSGGHIATMEDKRHAAAMLRTIGAETVVLTDENGPNDAIVDFIAGGGAEDLMLSYPRPRSRHVRGVSSALATAIAVFVARGGDRASAIQHARMHVAGAVAHAPETGEATDPPNHGYAALFEPLQRG